MKKSLIAFCSLFALVPPAYADLDDAGRADLLEIQREWAHVKYETPSHDEQSKAIAALAERSAAATASHGDAPEFMVWQAIVLSTEAGIDGGLGALGKAKEARKLLEAAAEKDPNVLDGSINTSLGSLYYQVPGWPIGFGDKKKARKYLDAALEASPHGMDSNFFMADFLYRQGQYKAALDATERALNAPDRPGREVADAGRRGEINELRSNILNKLRR